MICYAVHTLKMLDIHQRKLLLGKLQKNELTFKPSIYIESKKTKENDDYPQYV